jgi:hypothetical protein
MQESMPAPSVCTGFGHGAKRADVQLVGRQPFGISAGTEFPADPR